MIDRGIFYLRPMSDMPGCFQDLPSRNSPMPTGAPALRAMELLVEDPEYSGLKPERSNRAPRPKLGSLLGSLRWLWPWRQVDR